MHDPRVLAHTIPTPIPRHVRHQEMHDARCFGRWGLGRSRRTNPENLGEPTYPWWRLAGWTLRIAGRSYRLHTLAYIWHHEPGGRDAFTVCDRRSSWRWHIRHWEFQWIAGRHMFRRDPTPAKAASPGVAQPGPTAP